MEKQTCPFHQFRTMNFVNAQSGSRDQKKENTQAWIYIFMVCPCMHLYLFISMKLNMKTIPYTTLITVFPDFLSHLEYTTLNKTDVVYITFFSPFSCFLFLLFTCPLCPHPFSSNLVTLVHRSLTRLWIPALPQKQKNLSAASKIASVLASGLKGETSTNEWSDNHMLSSGRGRRWADGSVQFWDDMLPQRPFLRAADLLQGMKKCFHSLSNAADKWNSRTKLQFGNWKVVDHWESKALVWEFWLLNCLFFFPSLFSLTYK